MKKILAIVLALSVFTVVRNYAQVKPVAKIPAHMAGSFTDDYGIRYIISDTLWLQLPRTRFHIIRWNLAQQYLIARNDAHNPGEGGLYTRIDFMRFTGMEPWNWGYCLTAYNAKSDAEAEATAAADREHPKKGCNGFPFSRMMVVK
ncbi:hypothetical protein HQ865_18785 [Mucilaginibacter mali]|uniref:Uncharacterized protein n=1 Tax=Mucilaginibacter mali TaxID=2740462 RepID=A0A7D4Q2X9_9SPHI|nr:hypothetical protein [Mucilaginibacter mali]QKJ31726.1 hypothetical protein HQ865_18785 [Mucilaginibacter mali]